MRSSELATLQRAIGGRVILPSAALYESVRRPQIARFDDICPAAIVQCATPTDVAEAIAFARRAGLDMATRSGGHCFAGRSSTRGVLIDISPMDSVSVAN